MNFLTNHKSIVGQVLQAQILHRTGTVPGVSGQVEGTCPQGEGGEREKEEGKGNRGGGGGGGGGGGEGGGGGREGLLNNSPMCMTLSACLYIIIHFLLHSQWLIQELGRGVTEGHFWPCHAHL